MRVFRTETFEDAIYDEIVSLLRSGGIIAFPTDTAYGLGADPFNTAAIDRIFQIKGRPET
ncbi:MAG TPA: Sua5/YciO/YrdC/YwlC family protein, partial [Terriglobia bacterium]|nr:Sua5/YciO/YrdC/YwlC family protein [Terriglobia bacterium]